MNNKRLRLTLTLFVLFSLTLLCLFACAFSQSKEPLVLDMVHFNPGEAPYESVYNDPAYVKKVGFNGKVYSLFESPTLAITWESVDKDILPKGSPEREWVDAKATKIREMQAACKKQHLKVLAMADFILFPKRLIAKFGIEKTFGDPNNPITIKLVKAQIDEIFAQFPDMDGLVVRIGETYLQDAPYHLGSIVNKKDAQKTIIPLMKLLREQVCVKNKKILVFRTWGSFDVDAAKYKVISDAVEPHPNLIIGVKYCEGDFHRANPFSKVIGLGRHPQIIEVQCAREYEGKGAYPNYIAHGVIDGFEEYSRMPEEAIDGLQEFADKRPELYAGVWTWSRGGGWRGPYIKNELWCDLNAQVMSHWAKDPTVSEEHIFNGYAKKVLKLQGKDIKAFRRFCLLSAEAVVRGRNSTYGDMNPWWTRDQGIGWPSTPKSAEAQQRNLKQKDESISKWKEMLQIAYSIHWNDEETKEFVLGSTEYGLCLYQIYRILVNMSYADSHHDNHAIVRWIKEYDEAWKEYKELPKRYTSLSTLYTQDYHQYMISNADKKVNALRDELLNKKK